MKTPLPDKYTKLELQAFHSGDSVNAMIKINQLITYLAELTEVVEGKQENDYYEALPDLSKTTPTLKEQLLGETSKLKRAQSPMHDAHQYYAVKDYNQALSDVQAIVNRLIP
jgi:hypothetical protein